MSGQSLTGEDRVFTPLLKNFLEGAIPITTSEDRKSSFEPQILKKRSTILAINTEGRKKLIDMYISESEGANYWLSVSTDLKPVYRAVNKDQAEIELEKLEEKMEEEIPYSN